MIKILLLILVLIPQVSHAFFQKRLAYRHDDNRPIFRNDIKSPTKIYIGGGFSWYKGQIDPRGLGASTNITQSFHQTMYNANSAGGQEVKSNKIPKTSGLFQTGQIVIGIAPMQFGLLAYTRHELEFGSGNNTQNYSNISSANTWCGDDAKCLETSSSSTGYNSLSYDIKQKYLMYNLYIQPNITDNFGFFVGAGIGGVRTSVDYNASKTGGSSTNTAVTTLTSKNAMSLIYSFFVGATFDITDNIVVQGKAKYTAITAPHRNNDGTIKYDNPNIKPTGDMAKLYGLEVSVLLGY